MKKLNSNQIKLIMIVIVTLNSLQSFLPFNLLILYGLLENIAAAWFTFCTVEGIKHTNNILKYNIRMYTASLIMFTGNSVLNTIYGISNTQLSENGFFTLSICLTFLTVIDKYNPTNILNKIFKFFILIFLFFIGLLNEYGYLAMPLATIFYSFYNNTNKRNNCLILFSIILFISDILTGIEYKNIPMTVLSHGSFIFILILPILNHYSYTHGNNSKIIQYMFYIYYPLHIWIIAIIVNS